VKKEAPQKSKFKRLKRRLQLRHWQAVGLLESIWQCAALNAPDGDIGRLSNDEIAAELEWEGEADDLIDALADCDWLDRDEEFRLIVHDWSDHVPTWLKGAYIKNGKQFADQLAKHRSKSAKQAKDGGQKPAKQTSTDVLATTPNLTIPNLTEPDPTNTTGCAGDASGNGPDDEPSDPGKPPRKKHSYSETFERWYAIYPVKVGKEGASAAFGRAMKRIQGMKAMEFDEALDWLCSVTDTFASSPKGRGEYVKHPATWLNEGHYDDDQKQWNRVGGKPSHVGTGQRYQGPSEDA
jgi:hypothetical protein